MLASAAYRCGARGRPPAQQPAASHGWTPIFDGRSLAGWKGAAQYGHRGWRAGAARRAASDALCTERSYGDFVLRFPRERRSAGAPAVV
jgi:hypothetical protein